MGRVGAGVVVGRGGVRGRVSRRWHKMGKRGEGDADIGLGDGGKGTDLIATEIDLRCTFPCCGLVFRFITNKYKRT